MILVLRLGGIVPLGIYRTKDQVLILPTATCVQRKLASSKDFKFFDVSLQVEVPSFYRLDDILDIGQARFSLVLWDSRLAASGENFQVIGVQDQLPSAVNIGIV